MVHLQKLRNLLILDLSSTSVGDSGLATIASLHFLWELRLADTRVTDVGLQQVRRLTNLARLDLTGTDVSDAGTTYLEDVAGLEQLTLGSTRVTEQGIARLRRALPDLKIVR
jgi:hypothetical protein